jgi:hypothetical protein
MSLDELLPRAARPIRRNREPPNIQVLTSPGAQQGQFAWIQRSPSDAGIRRANAHLGLDGIVCWIKATQIEGREPRI